MDRRITGAVRFYVNCQSTRGSRSVSLTPEFDGRIVVCTEVYQSLFYRLASSYSFLFNHI
jgi:hypothetical protein